MKILIIDNIHPFLINELEKHSIICHSYLNKTKKEICAIMCFGFTDEVPSTVKELDLMTRDAYLRSVRRDQNIGQIAIAYTIWSKKKGGGKLFNCLTI